MCGIAGIVSLDRGPVENLAERVRRMTGMLTHRGPDSQGTFVSSDGRVGLGNTRLAISDPGCLRPQPMVSEDRRAVLTFNGELYNDRELRAELLAEGRPLSTQLDTEILLEGLNAHGQSFLQRLDGMWAFAFYDEPTGTVLLSRDLLGERHLFYQQRGRELIFASEIPPILADADRAPAYVAEHVATAMRFGVAPPGETLLEGVHRLRAGHLLRAAPDGVSEQRRELRLHPERWFDFFSGDPSLEQVIDRWEEVFADACLRRVPREVPYISTLSGGLDSALVCLYASDLGKRPIDTLFGLNALTPDQREPGDLPEFEASLVTARKVGANHQSRDIDTAECIPVLERIARNGFDGMLDEGVASFEMLGWIGRELGKKVMLISDGPDEFCGGYPIDQQAHAQGMVGAFSTPFHQIVEPDVLARVFTDSLSGEGFGRLDPVYSDVAERLDPPQIRALTYAACTVPDYCNLRTDKGFLRAAVESRSPYLAPRMVELMIALPACFRFGEDGSTKYLLRKIVERHVGPQVAWRSKHGFSAPLWFAPAVQQALAFEPTIRESRFLADFPFTETFRRNLFDPPFHKLRWSVYVLTHTLDSLAEICR